MADSLDAQLLEYWNKYIGRACCGCNRLQGRPQPAFRGHCCAGCREGEESKDKYEGVRDFYM